MKVKSLEIKWLGHASILIEDDEKYLYVDPWQIGRVRPDADIILLTHDHYDHFSVEDIDNITTDKTLIIGPEELREKLSGVRGEFRNISIGKELETSMCTVRAVPAYNVDKKFHPQENEWLGYVLEFEKNTVYIAGDTDLIDEMKNVECDIAILPVSGTYVMNAKDAAKAAKRVGASIAIPVHYGSIVGDEEDAKEFKKLCECTVKILDKE